MKARIGRIILVLMCVLAVFVAVAGIMMRVIPAPHRATDYLVIGAVATFASLLVLFVFLVNTWVKQPDLFYKRKNK